MKSSADSAPDRLAAQLRLCELAGDKFGEWTHRIIRSRPRHVVIYRDPEDQSCVNNTIGAAQFCDRQRSRLRRNCSLICLGILRLVAVELSRNAYQVHATDFAGGDTPPRSRLSHTKQSKLKSYRRHYLRSRRN